MKTPLDNDLNKAYEIFNQGQDHLRRTLMASLSDRSKMHKEVGRFTYAWQFIGGTIMKSRVTKIAAAAAVIVVAVLIGSHYFGGSIDMTSVAWADVVKPILNAQTVIMDILIGPEGRQVVIHDEVMGSRIRRTVSNVQGTDIIIDLEQMKALALAHAEKTAVYIELGGLPDLQNYVELLQDAIVRLQNKPDFQVDDQGLQEIDGQDYIVFVAESDKDTITIWADPETALPVRIKQKTPNMQIVCDNLQFDIELDESRFSMEVPDNYVIQEAGIDFKESSESGFIESLRIWAEIIEDGHFPESINLEDVVKIGRKLEQGLKRANLTEQQQLEVATRFGQGLVFLRFFKGEGKWRYAGVGVEFGDADTAIFWYRPKDSETWRVIYGDLHVEDVTGQDLPKPALSEKQAKIIRSSEQWEKQEFVGTEKDIWHITATGDIVAYSNITLTKMPQDASVMYIKLPYTCGLLKSVILDGEEILFSQVIKGRYELELPAENLLEGQTSIECVWSMPLEVLVKVDYGYRIRLQGLIPVEGFKLTVVLEPDCGFKYSKDPSQTKITLFKTNKLLSMMDNASCGLPVDKSN